MRKSVRRCGTVLFLAVVIAFLPLGTARAEESAEVAALRQEVVALRAEIEALKAAMRELQQGAAGATSPAAETAPPAAGAPSAAAGAATAPPPLAPSAAPARSANVMNPAISAVFQAIGQSFLDGREDANGFDLSEAEVAFESTVDPYVKMNLYLTFPVDESPEVEEGYAQTLALPAGLQLKGGRFKESFGKWNLLHTHAFPTVERPDALVNFFGEESLTNDGLSLSWLIPNPAGLYLESVTEAGTAREGPSFNSEARALTWSQHLSAFFNPSDNATLEFGLSGAFGQTGPTETLLADLDAAGLTGILVPDERTPSNVYGADVTWKWKPLSANTYRSLTAQAEVLRSRRHAQTLSGASLDEEILTSDGGYLYLEGQWIKRWKIGLRGDLAGFPDSETDRTWSAAGVVKFAPSEFQEIRFQVKRTRLNPGAAARAGGDGDQEDTQVFFEWIPIIGAHGAHKY
ncbi:MAG TPA: hypothetical protein VFD06_03500 [Candidatus Polarisedimenticolia bacterium]|nr:hypothetical protein [Candidatus Polarisedimenticolia bacterium]